MKLLILWVTLKSSITSSQIHRILFPIPPASFPGLLRSRSKIKFTMYYDDLCNFVTHFFFLILLFPSINPKCPSKQSAIRDSICTAHSDTKYACFRLTDCTICATPFGDFSIKFWARQWKQNRLATLTGESNKTEKKVYELIQFYCVTHTGIWTETEIEH